MWNVRENCAVGKVLTRLPQAIFELGISIMVMTCNSYPSAKFTELILVIDVNLQAQIAVKVDSELIW